MMTVALPIFIAGPLALACDIRPLDGRRHPASISLSANLDLSVTAMPELAGNVSSLRSDGGRDMVFDGIEARTGQDAVVYLRSLSARSYALNMISADGLEREFARGSCRNAISKDFSQ